MNRPISDQEIQEEMDRRRLIESADECGLGGRRVEEELEREEQTQIRKVKGPPVIDLLKAIREGGYWINRRGHKVPVEKIDNRYARNLLRWMERRVDQLHREECLFFASLPEPTADMAQAGYEAEMNQLFQMNPREWLKEQPLYKELDVLVKRGVKHGQ